MSYSQYLDDQLADTAQHLRRLEETHPQLGKLSELAAAIDAQRADLQERVLTYLSLDIGTRRDDIRLRRGITGDEYFDATTIGSVLDELRRRGLAAQRGGWWRATKRGLSNVV